MMRASLFIACTLALQAFAAVPSSTLTFLNGAIHVGDKSYAYSTMTVIEDGLPQCFGPVIVSEKGAVAVSIGSTPGAAIPPRSNPGERDPARFSWKITVDRVVLEAAPRVVYLVTKHGNHFLVRRVAELGAIHEKADLEASLLRAIK